MRSNVIDLTLILHHETDRAVLVSDTGERKDAVWLPKAAIEIDHLPGRQAGRGAVVITLPTRLAIDRGLA